MPADKTLGLGTLIRMSHKNGALPSAVSRSPSPSMRMPAFREASPSNDPPMYIASTIPENETIMPRTSSLSPWGRAKLILNITSIGNAIVTMVLTSFMASAPNDMTNAIGFFIAPPAAAAALWNVAELARRVDVPGGNGIHPGAHVGIRLVLCGSLITMASMITSLGFMSANTRAAYREVGPDGAVFVGGSGQKGDAPPVAWAIIAMCGVGAAIEFVLFVRACCEEDWRRKAIKRARREEMRKVECACGIRE
ncbi:hypothetical protein B0T11DRAFT_359728 [Plectosphaerella cucumerina]|uniref:Uncharacterized protein n=1 Tax=Plectosphaerella cucumerina TaxID=40658 RepID=A0A8K0WY79_9PEZI|nr:hypothetical protein B0T11DRAFT_359728 [Plectosphaerella cucumerina]